MDAETEALLRQRLVEWLTMCASTPEFVDNYNRLCGANLKFDMPQRSAIEAMVDRATGHVPTPSVDRDELHRFFDHCADLFGRVVLGEFARSTQGAA